MNNHCKENIFVLEIKIKDYKIINNSIKKKKYLIIIIMISYVKMI